MPQPFAEYDGRVGADGHDRSGEGLGDIVELDKIRGADLQVHLEAGIAGFQQGRIVFDQDLIDAGETQFVGGADQLGVDGIHEGEIPGFGGEVFHLQVELAQGR